MFSRTDSTEFWLPLPVVLVDDEQKLREEFMELVGLEYPERELHVFESLDDARRNLFTVTNTRPFGLVLDHNLGGEEKGWELGTEVRNHHPWGLAIPIVYWSGYMGHEKFSEQVANLGSLAPTCLMRKQNYNIIDAVNKIDEDFSIAAPAFLQHVQSLRAHEFDLDKWDSLLTESETSA